MVYRYQRNLYTAEKNISFTLQMHVPPYRLSTAGRRSFPLAASIFWNTLPANVQSAPCASSFWRQLLLSFSDILVSIFCIRSRVLCNATV